jgi:hypothetical protein
LVNEADFLKESHNMAESVENSILQSKIDNRLQRIANVLLLYASFNDNIGLLNGKMGISIFFYNYARYTGNKVFEDHAGDLIDEIYEEINTNTPVDFANGLTGIGWGIEHLVKNGFLEADTDEVLEELDNIVFRKSSDKHYNDNLFGYGFYYMARLRGRENDYDNPAIFSKKKHLIFLVDQCERILAQKGLIEFNIPSLSIDIINSFTWFLLEIYRLKLSPVKVEKLFHVLTENIRLCLKDSDDNASQLQLLRLTDFIVASVSDISLQKELNEILKQNDVKAPYYESIEDVMIKDFIKDTWQQMIYEPYIKRDRFLQRVADKVFLIIDTEGNWNIRINKLNDNNIGLIGFAGLGLGLLSEQMGK